MKIQNSKLKIQNCLTGFTLIELILYVAVVSIVLTSLIPFAWDIIGGSVKSSAQQEVFSQARSVSERIKYEIRNATDITNFSPTSITLSGDATTIISWDGVSKVRINQGGGEIDLNSADTKITSFTFTNYSSADNKTKNIQFNFTIDDNYNTNRQEYDVPAITVQSAAEMRSN